MKLIVSESQLNSLIDNNSLLLGSMFSKVFQKKYDWFEKIEIESIEVRGTKYRVIIDIYGKVYVDGDWGYKMFRKYHWSSNFSDDIRFGDIIGSDIGSEFRDWFQQIYESIYNKKIFLVNISGLLLELVDNEEKD